MGWTSEKGAGETNARQKRMIEYAGVSVE